MGKKVVILNAYYPNYDVERSVLEPLGAEVIDVVTGKDLEKTKEVTRDAAAIMTRETELPRELIESLDLDAARERGIYVANVGDYGTQTVAEHAVALMFAVTRRIVTRDRDTRAGKWDIGADEPMYSFDGKTLGVCGLGKIGRAFLHKVSCLGFSRVLGYDPYVSELEGVELTDLDTLFSQSDVISLHMPLTPESYHLVDAVRLQTMKPTSVLINTARGGLVDIDALADALEAHKIFGAGLDVFEEEPPDTGHRLFTLDNVVVTDHTGWYSVESLELLQRKAANEVARVLQGEKPTSWVNRWE
jgi:D-3-phosphoglycerate dehydrogenase